jgi:hypothetical protein
MGQRRPFTSELKRQAVQLLNARQRPAVETVRELGGDVTILIVLRSR